MTAAVKQQHQNQTLIFEKLNLGVPPPLPPSFLGSTNDVYSVIDEAWATLKPCTLHGSDLSLAGAKGYRRRVKGFALAVQYSVLFDRCYMLSPLSCYATLLISPLLISLTLCSLDPNAPTLTDKRSS